MYLTREEDGSRIKVEAGAADTGANVSVTTPAVAEKFNKTVINYGRPVYIQVAKSGIKMQILGVADFGPFLGNFEIVPQATMTLVSINQFTDNGHYVIFDKDAVTIRHANGAVLYKGLHDQDTGLWYIDIEEILSGPTLEQILAAHATSREHGGLIREQAMVLGISKTERLTKQLAHYIINLHRTYDHMSEADLCRIIKTGAWDDLPEEITTELVHKVFSKYQCIACALSFKRSLNKRTGSGVPAMVIGDTIAADYVGKYHPLTVDGASGAFLFMCLATGYVWAFLTRTKGADEFLKCCEIVRDFLFSYGWAWKKLRVDSGSVENSEAVKSSLARHGCVLDTAPPEEQGMNPLERYKQTLNGKVAAMLQDQTQATTMHWGPALLNAVDIRNSLVNSSSEHLPHRQDAGARGMSPMEAITNQRPRAADHKHPFGTRCVVKKTGGKQSFGQTVNEEGFIVGREPGRAGALRVIFHRDPTKVYVRYQVHPLPEPQRPPLVVQQQEVHLDDSIQSDEAISTWIREDASVEATVDDPLIEMQDEGGEEQVSMEPMEISSETLKEEALPTLQPLISGGQARTVQPLPGFEQDDYDSGDEGQEEPVITPHQYGPKATINPDELEQLMGRTQHQWERMTDQQRQDSRAQGSDRVLRKTHTKRVLSATLVRSTPEDEYTQTTFNEQEEVHAKDDEFNEVLQVQGEYSQQADGTRKFTVNLVRKATKVGSDPDHPKLEEAQQDKYMWDNHWRPAVQVEEAGIQRVMREVKFEDIPPGAFISDMMVDLRIKRCPKTNEVSKYKVRINVRGDQEIRRGVFEDPADLFSPTPRWESVMIIIAIAAYLGLKMFGWDVVSAFLSTPATREAYVRYPKSLTDYIQHYYLLLSSIYGQGDASKNFYEHLARWLKHKQYIRSQVEPCIWTKWDGERFIAFTVHIDDGGGTTNDDQMREQLYADLREIFAITTQPTLETMIGMQIVHNTNGSITVIGPKHVQNLLKATYPEGNIPFVTTPMAVDWSEEDLDDAELVDVHIWCERLGIVLYIGKYRHDIAQTVSKFSRRTNKVTTKDMAAMQRLAAYLHFTREVGLTFHPGARGTGMEDIQLTAFVDAAFNVYLDSKSQYGVLVKLGDKDDPSGMFSASSKTSKSTTPSSSAEAELGAAHQGTLEVMYQRDLLYTMGFQQLRPTPTWEDNQPLMDVTKPLSKGAKRMKHAGLKIAVVREGQEEGITKLMKISGLNHPADAATKPLSGPQHWKYMPALQGEHPAVWNCMRQAGIRIANVVLRRPTSVHFHEAIEMVPTYEEIHWQDRDMRNNVKPGGKRAAECQTVNGEEADREVYSRIDEAEFNETRQRGTIAKKMEKQGTAGTEEEIRMANELWQSYYV